MRKLSTKFAHVAAVLLAGTASAFAADVTIPSTGLDIGAYISAGIVLMASVAAVAVGGYFAFLVVRKALGWAKKAM